MTTSFDIGVDWRRKGLICWDARPVDALNLLPNPLRIDQYYRHVYDQTNSGRISTVVNEKSPYGIRLLRVSSPNVGERSNINYRSRRKCDDLEISPPFCLFTENRASS